MDFQKATLELITDINAYLSVNDKCNHYYVTDIGKREVMIFIEDEIGFVNSFSTWKAAFIFVQGLNFGIRGAW